MKLIINQCRAVQGAAILAAIAREHRTWHLVEGDGLGAVNADRRVWLYTQAASTLVPGLADERPEPQYEDYEPDPMIDPMPVFILQEPIVFQKPAIEYKRSATVGASIHLPKVLVPKWEEDTLSA